MSSFLELISGNKPVVVDFYAEWCGPCKAMKPVLDEFKKNVGEKALVLKVDVDRNVATARAYHVQSVPTLAIFKNGKIVWRRSGVLSAHDLQWELERFL